MELIDFLLFRTIALGVGVPKTADEILPHEGDVLQATEVAIDHDQGHHSAEEAVVLHLLGARDRVLTPLGVVRDRRPHEDMLREAPPQPEMKILQLTHPPLLVANVKDVVIMTKKVFV